MATIEDLDQKSISELSTDEALELLRQIRLSRRTIKSSYKRPASKTKAQKAPAKMSSEQAKKLLELLGG